MNPRNQLLEPHRPRGVGCGHHEEDENHRFVGAAPAWTSRGERNKKAEVEGRGVGVGSQKFV